MSDRIHGSGRRPLSRFARVALPAVFVLIASAGTLYPQDTPPEQTPAPAAATSDVKPDAKKAKASYELGNKAEREGDWDAAYTDYIDAANYSPANRDYVVRREIAKSRVVQSKMDIAERDAISGRLDDAQKQLLSASFIDPLNPAVRKRLAELATSELDKIRKKPDVQLAGEPQLEYKTGTHSFDYRGDTQGAYQEIARQFGVEVAFDVDMRSRQVRFRVDEVDFSTAVRLLGNETATFWRPLSTRLFFVADSNTQKRKDFEPSVVRTVLLPASETPDQMTEVVRMVRDVTGITRTQLDTANRTITMRASPRAVALASNLIDDLEKPTGELILEIEILEVDRTNAQNLGIVPPESANAFTISTEQAREAAASEEGLIDVIEQVLGTSTPNVIAFGGGFTTYFATLPNISANFSQMLSTVKTGRRVLLRAQDGRAADFFVGERFPVSLATFSPSLLNGSTTGATTGAINNPLTNYAAGNSPSFITSNVLRGDSTFEDLIVANSADNTISILLGNGDGTFENQVAYNLPATTDKDPVWITTGAFDTPNDSNIDLAVANKGSNTVSILLGQMDSTTGLATGTFVPGVDLTTGNAPDSVVAADFHDKANTGFLDLAVANLTDDSISIFQGNGNGTFLAPTLVKLIPGFQPTALATANLTNSGHVDLIVAEQSATTGNAGQVQILLGNGDGTFSQAQNSPYAAGNAPSFVATGDFNGDGVTDFAVTDSGAPSTSSTGTGVAGNAVSIYFGNPNTSQVNVGSGTFTAQTLYPAGNGPTSIAVADFNQDGFLDLAVSDTTDNAVTLLFNEGTGIFTSPIPEIPVGTAPVSIVTEDFNADGLPDAATADNGAAEATVILNSASLLGANTSAGAAGTQFPGAQYLDIGLKIKATPRIHPNKEVTLDLSFDISSLSAQSFNAIPVINNETVTQTVRLKQDETAAVAGFRSTQLSNAVTGNPGLSQIPGLGLLDQDATKNNADTQLLILVTPRMVRYSPRADHVIYAGQGSVDGQGGGESAPNIVAPPVPAPAPPPGNVPPGGNAPPQPAPDQGQPGQPAPQNAPPPQQPQPQQ
jgi:Bacterial type II and III secretion system protein/FG-GAP-like repeat